MNQLDQRIERVFQEVFEDDRFRLRDDLSSKDVPQWDSLAQLRLVMGLEEEFGVKFGIHELAQLNSVGDMKRVLAAHTAPAAD